MPNYEANDLEIYEGLSAVRKRPNMYIGQTDKIGLHHLVWEIVDNSIDEVLAGFATKVDITITKDNEIIVADDGRGIPVDIHQGKNKSGVEVVFTELHAGGKFGQGVYAVSGGLHGVGASVVNALSSYLKVWVRKNNKLYFQEFKNGGVPVKPLEQIGESPNETGTVVLFKPDYTIMENVPFDFDMIKERSRQSAYLNKGIIINVEDQRINKKVTYHYEGGIKEFINVLDKNYDLVHKDIIYAEDVVKSVNSKNEPVEMTIEVAMRYNYDQKEKIFTYANNIYTKDGGVHKQGFTDAIFRIMSNYIEKIGLIKPNAKEKEKISKEDISEGLAAIVSIKHTDPSYEGQTKTKFNSKEARPAVNKVISSVFERFLAENPTEAKAIAQRILNTQKARLQYNKYKETTKSKGVFGKSASKLANCSSRNAEETELYIVEGDSAGGTAKQGRNPKYQAILPLRGKIINSEKTNLTRLLENEEIISLIVSLGTGIGVDFNINKLKYHKIVIMTDADVDGAHIRTLLLTFFYRHLTPLIEYGFVYIAQPPLYKIEHGKKIQYAYDDNEKDKIVASFAPNTKLNIQRYKGLGEMDEKQLWETTMDPERRTMLQVQIEDAIYADSIFSTLMGEDVQPRREYIEEHAKYVKNLDV